MINVLFVCAGNTCRSPMCEYLLKDMLSKKDLTNEFVVESRGVCVSGSEFANQNAVKAVISLTNNDNIKKHVAKQVSTDIIKKSDYIFALDDFVFDYLLQVFEQVLNNKQPENLYLFNSSGVPDPYGSNFENYLGLARKINTSLEDILKNILKNISR